MISLRLAAIAVCVFVLAGTALAGTPKKITAAGVGAVKLGMTHQELRSKGLVGKLQPGCELGGPDTRAALLKPPLKGAVGYTTRKPHRVRDIIVRGGATARGVGVGDPLREVKAAYPKATVDKSTADTFRIWLVKVPKNGGGRLQFAVGSGSRKVSSIGVPYIPFCE